MNKKQVELWSPWILLVAVIVLWQILCSAFEVSEFIFPSPWRIWTQFWEFKGIIAGHAWRTFWVTMAGFGIAIVVGVLLGFVIGSSRLAYAAVYPLMTAFNALPKAAFVPTLVVWFGIGVGPAILTAFLISFFPIMVNIATGLATLEPELEDVLRVLGAKRWDVLVKVGLPRSMPYFFGSLKVAITLAFVGTTVSEMTASNEGIGYLLISAGSAMQMGLDDPSVVHSESLGAAFSFYVLYGQCKHRVDLSRIKVAKPEFEVCPPGAHAYRSLPRLRLRLRPL